MRAVLDACVLYPTILREILIGTAAHGLFRPLWSDRLLGEWTRTAARRGGPGDEAIAQGDIARLNAAWPDACIAHDPGVEASLWLPDTGDIHVLATAIAGGADTIITLNLRDFPRRELSVHGIEARHPDSVLMDFWLARPDPVEATVASVVARATAVSGPNDRTAHRPMLKRARLPRLAKATDPDRV